MAASKEAENTIMDGRVERKRQRCKQERSSSTTLDNEPTRMQMKLGPWPVPESFPQCRQRMQCEWQAPDDDDRKLDFWTLRSFSLNGQCPGPSPCDHTS